jgi:hypothetical protein
MSLRPDPDSQRFFFYLCNCKNTPKTAGTLPRCISAGRLLRRPFRLKDEAAGAGGGGEGASSGVGSLSGRAAGTAASTGATRWNETHTMNEGSVRYPWHFGVDPDPWIHASDYWIRIRTPTKNYKKKYFAYFFLKVYLLYIIFQR